jgi:hypothetical protein
LLGNSYCIMSCTLHARDFLGPSAWINAERECIHVAVERHSLVVSTECRRHLPVTPCAAALNWTIKSPTDGYFLYACDAGGVKPRWRGAVFAVANQGGNQRPRLETGRPPGATCRPISTVSIAIAHAALRATDESLNQKFVHGRHHYLTNNAASRE